MVNTEISLIEFFVANVGGPTTSKSGAWVCGWPCLFLGAVCLWSGLIEKSVMLWVGELP